jgi:hypothetical protein
METEETGERAPLSYGRLAAAVLTALVLAVLLLPVLCNYMGASICFYDDYGGSGVRIIDDQTNVIEYQFQWTTRTVTPRLEP